MTDKRGASLPATFAVFKRILVAFDGSKNSARAADVAISAAEDGGAVLFFISVIQNPVLTQVAIPGSGAAAGAMKGYMDQAKEVAEGIVGKLVGKAKADG